MKEALATAAMCASCGATIPAGKAKCPHCGRPRSPQWPDKQFAVYAPEPSPPTQDAAPQMITAHAIGKSAADAAASTPAQHFSPLIPWLEFILGAIGVHGVGYLLVRKPGRAIAWFAFSALWDGVRVGLGAATGGVACICLLPAGLLISFAIFLNLATIIRHANAHRGAVQAAQPQPAVR